MSISIAAKLSTFFTKKLSIQDQHAPCVFNAFRKYFEERFVCILYH